jgi:hypothetical protein
MKNVSIFLLITLCLLVYIDFVSMKDNKHKTSKHHQQHVDSNKKEQRNQQNNTLNSHSNHTHQSDIGWSLHSNPNQAPAANPNGYSIQHPSHGDSHQGHPHQANSPGPQGVQSQTQQGMQQHSNNDNSGLAGVAMGGIGGLAVGAAGGYLLSNALNSDKDEDKPTSLLIDTTISTLELKATVAENMLEISTLSNVAETSPSDSKVNEVLTTIESEETTLTASANTKLGQDTSEAQETARAMLGAQLNCGLINRTSLIVFALVASFTFIAKFRMS